MTDTLKKAIADAGSIRAISLATGVSRQSMMYFMSGERSLRLDIADKLAAHFGLELQPRPQRKKDK